MDYYDILGVSKGATKEEIKKAYRQKARETHPDVNNGDLAAEEKFKQVSEAYSVLGDDTKRAEYDNPEVANFGNIEDFINAHFAGGPFGAPRRRTASRAPNTPEPGPSVRARQDISLYDSMFGVTLTGVAGFVAKCDECNGLGGSDFTSVCSTCGGRGFQETNSGRMVIRNACGECSGAGVLPKNKCPGCSGHGKKHYDSEYTLGVPAGFRGGSLLVEGAGAPGVFGGPSGDLMVEVAIRFPEVDTSQLSNEEISVLKKFLS